MDQIRALLQNDPDDPFLHFSLAMELASADHPDEALARYDHVLRLDPNYLSAHFRKSDLLLRLQRAPDARAALRTGIEAAQRVGNAHLRDKMQEMLDRLG